MIKYHKQILIGVSLLIFFLLIGSACAVENITNSNSSSQETPTISSDESNVQISSVNSEIDDKLDSSDIIYEGDVFINPDFEEGNLDKSGDIYGWNVTSGGAHGGSTPDGQINKIGDNRVLHVPTTSYYGNKISQNINFDFVDNISFKYTNPDLSESIYNLISQEQYASYRSNFIATFEITAGTNYLSYTTPIVLGWDEVIIDTKNVSGYGLFEISIPHETKGSGINKLYFDNFIASLNDKVESDFSYVSNLIDNNISVEFTNKAIGKISNIFWDFGDGANSSEINPTHTFKPGNYKVTLTISNENNTDSYSYDLSLNYPTINGQMYSTVQDAIDNAEVNAIIDVPSDFSENLNIKQNLTLNFNGNKLTGTINVNDGAIVTVTNISDVSSVSTDDSSKLTITDSNINSDLELRSGNILLDGNEFTGSFITVVNANAIIANNNIANGGIKVNGGKSKINNNVLSGNDVAITQTEGETNITSNVIADNNIGVNVTNGTANINFNVIYNNNKVALAYVGSVDASNNWFGVLQATFSTTVSEDVDVYAPNAEQPAWLVLTLNCNETTLSSAQNYTVGVDLTLNSKGENTSSIGTLPKFSLPISTELGQASAVNIENSIGEFTLTTATLTSDDAIFTINGEDYTLDVNIFKIEDRINELETQLADAQDNATKLANKLEEANKKVENLTNQLNETQANATKLAEDLADANQKADNLTTQLSEAQKTIQNLSDPISTTVAANTLSIKALDSGNIQVTLKDANNNLLANKDVQVIINGVVYNGKTGNDGVAKIAVKFASAGTYYATVSFAGDNTYKSSIGTSKVVVSKKATKITAPKKTFKAKVKTKKVTITLKSGSTVLKSKKITLKVNGKTYTAKTNSKGVATIKVTKLTKKGTFTYTVKFAGDKAYNAITKKGKITIK